MKSKKVRRCKLCGGALEPENILLCNDCQSAGFTLPRGKDLHEEELLKLAQEREKRGVRILQGLHMEEIAAMARAWNAAGYISYGKFRAYCDTMGKLPPRQNNEV